MVARFTSEENSGRDSTTSPALQNKPKIHDDMPTAAQVFTKNLRHFKQLQVAEMSSAVLAKSDCRIKPS